MNNAEINIRNVVIGGVKSSNTIQNTDYALCKSDKPTTAEVKCSLPSSLINLKSINYITLTNNTDLNGYSTLLTVKIDQNYAIAASNLPSKNGKLIHLEGEGKWQLSGNDIVEVDLESVRHPSANRVETVIPASSCFNLTLRESITEIILPFTAIGKLKLADSFSVLNEISISGEISANILEMSYGQAHPCGN